MKVKIKDISVGKFDVDSILVTMDGIDTQICFNKDQCVEKYIGKDVELEEIKGIYTITEITKK